MTKSSKTKTNVVEGSAQQRCGAIYQHQAHGHTYFSLRDLWRFVGLRFLSRVCHELPVDLADIKLEI